MWIWRFSWDDTADSPLIRPLSYSHMSKNKLLFNHYFLCSYFSTYAKVFKITWIKITLLDVFVLHFTTSGHHLPPKNNMQWQKKLLWVWWLCDCSLHFYFLFLSHILYLIIHMSTRIHIHKQKNLLSATSVSFGQKSLPLSSYHSSEINAGKVWFIAWY